MCVLCILLKSVTAMLTDYSSKNDFWKDWLAVYGASVPAIEEFRWVFPEAFFAGIFSKNGR